jgi:hypothetical protein
MPKLRMVAAKWLTDLLGTCSVSLMYGLPQFGPLIPNKRIERLLVARNTKFVGDRPYRIDLTHSGLGRCLALLDQLELVDLCESALNIKHLLAIHSERCWYSPRDVFEHS